MLTKKKSSLTEEQKRKMVSLTNNRLQDNIYLMLRHHPFYSSLLSRFGIETEVDETNKKCPVAAVSIQKGRPIRHTNPLGYMTYQQKEQIFIDIHEILHITDLHHLRMKGKDPGLWNLVTDIEINQQLKSEIAVLPKDALMYYHFNLPEGLSAEEYYEILESRDEPITLPPELQNTLLNDLINGGDQESNGNGGGADNQKQQENGKGQGKQKSEKAPGFENLHPQWAEMAEKSPEIQKGVIQSMVREAMVRAAGSIPGEMKAIIERLFEPQLNWPQLLATFAQSLLSTKRRYTWSRPSRKFGAIKMGTLRTKELNLWVLIDTSMSTKEHLTAFLGEISGMKDYAKITIIQIDYNIHSIEDINEIDLETFEIRGLGGTSFAPGFELATEGKIGDGSVFTIDEKPDGIVYLTDGEAYDAPENCDIPTLWVLTPGGRIPKCKSGKEVDWTNARFVFLDQ